MRDGQNYKDAPDFLALVYRLKQKDLLTDIWEAGVLGKALYYVWVTEFQKRMLAHMHMVFKFYQEDRPRRPEDIDALVSAEIPYPDEEPEPINL